MDETRQDESFSKVLTKSIESPEDLSLTELIRLDAYYSGILDQLLSAQTARTTGLVDGEFSEIAEIIGKIYFSNEFARAWWRQVRTDWVSTFNNDFQAALDKAILEGEIGRAKRIYEGILNELSEEQ